MRQIKFRGKRVDNGEWVVGEWFGGDVIRGYYVIPDSKQQFVWIKDKNKKDVFEGDIDKHKYGNRVIVFDNTHLCFIFVFVEYYKKYIELGIDKCGCTFEKVTSKKNGKIEIIGNIHDSPSLTNH